MKNSEILQELKKRKGCNFEFAKLHFLPDEGDALESFKKIVKLEKFKEFVMQEHGYIESDVVELNNLNSLRVISKEILIKRPEH